MKLEINFKKMKTKNDGGTAEIEAECENKKCTVELSILQLAKVWNVDKEIVEEAEERFGSTELEKKCNEIRKIISKFPKVKIPENKINLDSTSFVIDNKPEASKEFINFIGEDLCGWSNEGIIVKMPVEIDKKHNINFFDMILYPEKVEIIKRGDKK